MHQTRSEVIRGLPLERKGTTYVARALSKNSFSVPVVIAIRDMLKLATNSKEVKLMVHKKMLKINNRIVRDMREPISLFGVLHAGKNYSLNVMPTGRYVFEETKEASRLCKIISKRTVTDGKTQYSFHDGTSLLITKPANIGDTMILDFENKVVKHIPLAKQARALVMAGSNIGALGKITSFEGTKVTMKLDNSPMEVVLNRSQVIVQ